MKIAIADDFTGAAEIAGVGLQHGLSVSLSLDLPAEPNELTVIALNTRAKSRQEAVKELTTLTQQLPDTFIFKKIDSLLRGHIEPEIEAMLSSKRWSSALIAAGNPSLNRLITNGRYTVDGVPLHETKFARELPKGIVDVRHDKDLERWAKQITPSILPVGGAAFFATIFPKRLEAFKPKLGGKRLIVSGSSVGEPLDFVLTESQHILQSARTQKTTMVGASQVRGLTSEQIQERLALLAEELLAAASFDELIIEGGETAYTIIQRLRWKRFTPTHVLAPGLVRLRVDECPSLFLTVKPGSYPWSLRRFFCDSSD